VLDIGVTKLAIIGGIALIVIGPEKLPSVAKTVGTLLGRARRYVADVKAEVNRSMELDELKKMKDTMETAARDVENSIQSTSSDFEQTWADATGGLNANTTLAPPPPTFPEYKHPKKMACQARRNAQLVQSAHRHSYQGIVRSSARGAVSSSAPGLTIS
jgi:sec-independent protein translocase protein TatB